MGVSEQKPAARPRGSCLEPREAPRSPGGAERSREEHLSGRPAARKVVLNMEKSYWMRLLILFGFVS